MVRRFNGPRRIAAYTAQGAQIAEAPTTKSVTPCSPPCRVGAEDCSSAPLTEPDMRASHPALWIGLSEWQDKLP
jgi:hypothetical protein